MLTEPAATAILRLTEDTTAAAPRVRASLATIVENVPRMAIAEPTKTTAMAAMIAKTVTAIAIHPTREVTIIVPAVTTAKADIDKTVATMIAKVALFVAPLKASVAPAAIIANKKATKVATIRAVTTNSAVATRRVPATPAATMPAVTGMADTTARIKADTIAAPRAVDSASPTPNDSIPANSALTTKRRPMIPTNPFASTSFSPMPAFARVAMPTNTSKPAWFR